MIETIKTVYKIWNKEDKCYASSYSRAYHDETEWDNPESARSANVHGEFKNLDKYEIHEMSVRETPITVVEPPKKLSDEYEKKKTFAEKVKNYMNENNMNKDDFTDVIWAHMAIRMKEEQ